MLETIKNAWSVVEIRKKILFTLFIIIIFRIGSYLPVPFVDLASLQAADTNDFFNFTKF